MKAEKQEEEKEGQDMTPSQVLTFGCSLLSCASAKIESRFTVGPVDDRVAE